MKKFSLSVLVHPVVCLLALCSMAATPLAHADTRALPDASLAILKANKIPPSAVSALVVEVGSNKPRLSWQADTPRNPASLMKLYTSYAALSLLGLGYQWNTPVWLQGTIKNPGPQGVLQGNVVIQGRGDPHLVMERVWMLLRQIREQGIQEIHGNIVLDRRYFADDGATTDAFDDEPGRPYNVRPEALLLNFKSVTLRFRPDPSQRVAWVSVTPTLAGLSVPRAVPLAAPSKACGDWRGDLRLKNTSEAWQFEGSYPPSCGERSWPLAYAPSELFNAKMLQGMWQEMGGVLTGRVVDGQAPVDVAPSFQFDSEPLPNILRDINKYSNNVMAEMVFLTLGSTANSNKTLGFNAQDARDILSAFVQSRTGCTAPSMVVDNGSGLSRSARSSAACMTRLLQSAWSSPVMPELMSALPIASTDGTLRKATGFGAAAGQAHLKTGTLKDSTGLAGYVLSRSGKWYVVVGMINHDNAPAARPALEALVKWVAED